MCDATTGSSGVGRSKCPICRSTFTSVDVVGGAELEAACSDSNKKGRGEADAAGSEIKEIKTPPPKVAALLQRWVNIGHRETMFSLPLQSLFDGKPQNVA